MLTTAPNLKTTWVPLQFCPLNTSGTSPALVICMLNLYLHVLLITNHFPLLILHYLHAEHSNTGLSRIYIWSNLNNQSDLSNFHINIPVQWKSWLVPQLFITLLNILCVFCLLSSLSRVYTGGKRANSFYLMGFGSPSLEHILILQVATSFLSLQEKLGICTEKSWYLHSE